MRPFVWKRALVKTNCKYSHGKERRKEWEIKRLSILARGMLKFPEGLLHAAEIIL